MAGHAEKKPYDVAISYAHEDEEEAKQLTLQLQRQGYDVFFDGFEQAQLGGAYLPPLLKEIYEAARCCVILVSQHYVQKKWTTYEFQVILDRYIQQITERKADVIPIRLDDVDLPGLPQGVVYWDLRKQSPDDIVAFLGQRLGKPETHPPAQVKRSKADTVLRLYPQNFLYLITGKDIRDQPIINLDCHFINESKEWARLRRLELLITPPESLPLQLMWNLFYGSSEDGLLQTKTADASVLQVAAGGSTLIGVQLVGPRVDFEHLWQPGTYTFEFVGWVNRRPRVADVDLRTIFQVDISEMDRRGLVYWARASDQDWEELGDRDNAVGIPLAIDAGTLSVA